MRALLALALLLALPAAAAAGQPIRADVPGATSGVGPDGGWFAELRSALADRAVCDDRSHPLSGVFPSLAAAQAAFPTLGLSSAGWAALEEDWAAIQTAINLTGAAGGGTVLVPRGRCVLNAPLAIAASGVHLVGGSDQVVLRFTGPAADWIDIGAPSGAQIAHVAVDDLYLLGAGQTGGAAIRAGNVAFLHLGRLMIDHPYDGLAFRRLNTVDAADVTVNDHRGSCLVLRADPASERSDGGDYRNLVCQGAFAGGDGIDIDGAVYAQRFTTAAVLGERVGLSVANSARSTTAFPSFLFFYGLETDGASDAAVVISAGDRIEFHNPDISNTSDGYAMPDGRRNTGDGCAFQTLPDTGYSYTRQIRVLGGRIGDTARCAASIRSLETSIVGATLGDSSKAGRGRAPTILVQDGARDVLLEGDRIGVQYGDGFVPSAGLSIQAGARRVLVTGNIFSGFARDVDLPDGTASPGVHVVGNLHSDGSYD